VMGIAEQYEPEEVAKMYASAAQKQVDLLRNLVLEEAAKVAEEWMPAANLRGDVVGYDLMKSIAEKIRALRR